MSNVLLIISASLALIIFILPYIPISLFLLIGIGVYFWLFFVIVRYFIDARKENKNLRNKNGGSKDV